MLVITSICQHERRMPTEVQIAVRVSSRVKRAVDAACKAGGVSQTCFVQDALLDNLEESADREDLPKLRREPTRPLRDLIRDLGRDGEL